MAFWLGPEKDSCQVRPLLSSDIDLGFPLPVTTNFVPNACRKLVPVSDTSCMYPCVVDRGLQFCFYAIENSGPGD